MGVVEVMVAEGGGEEKEVEVEVFGAAGRELVEGLDIGVRSESCGGAEVVVVVSAGIEEMSWVAELG